VDSRERSFASLSSRPSMQLARLWPTAGNLLQGSRCRPPNLSVYLARRYRWRRPPFLGQSGTLSALSNLASSVAELPKFNAVGDKIELLYEPAHFYDWLLVRLSSTPLCGVQRMIADPNDEQAGIRRAKRRIFLSALYIGKEQKELVSLTLLIVSSL
jgi:hypothetical protein